MVTLFANFTIFQYDYIVRISDRAKSVGNDYGSPTLNKLVQVLHNFMFIVSIK